MSKADALRAEIKNKHPNTVSYGDNLLVDPLKAPIRNREAYILKLVRQENTCNNVPPDIDHGG